MLSDENKPEHRLQEIVELVKRSGAVERAELLQQRYHDKAKKLYVTLRQYLYRCFARPAIVYCSKNKISVANQGRVLYNK